MNRENGQNLRIASMMIAAFLMATLGVTGCGKKPAETAAIQINNFSMTAEEFKKAFSEYKLGEDTPENRADFLNNLITRKVLLQEAQRMGLDTKPDFLKSIENFWEQSLLKSVIDAKMKGFTAESAVSDQEIQDYYAQWIKENPGEQKPLLEVRDLISWRMRAAKESKALEVWTDQLIQKAKIKTDKHALGLE